ncbi:putative lipoprotein [Bacteriovorax sp. BAL6_X]|uniref:hypothetical protein n=1 Tax=Bacteriovorax sp. BAL6_X TaxID=1201290 RepID=UPI000385B39F|nr:hypothetical protein [Bacteriovorax sp. BAL6_X]EPZ52402.1 putative lipoprotein [Bacteriovorax sp. BAL6_X]
MKILSSLAVLIFLLTSCNTKTVDENACDIESMKCYRGYPYSCDFIKQCSGIKHKFTKQVCSNAFNELFRGAKSKEVIEKYSPKILHCFNEKEFHNFNIDKKLRPKD